MRFPVAFSVYKNHFRNNRNVGSPQKTWACCFPKQKKWLIHFSEFLPLISKSVEIILLVAFQPACQALGLMGSLNSTTWHFRSSPGSDLPVDSPSGCAHTHTCREIKANCLAESLAVPCKGIVSELLTGVIFS